MSSALTKLVTIDANGSELIDGQQTRIMWAGESAILLCDGTGWAKISGKSIPMSASVERSSAQNINNLTATKIALNVALSESVADMVDTTNNRIYVRRNGAYSVSGMATYEYNLGEIPGKEAYAQIGINSDTSSATLPPFLTVVPTSTSTNFTAAHCALSSTRTVSAGDYFALIGIHTAGVTMQTRTVNTVRPHLEIVEIPSW